MLILEKKNPFKIPLFKTYPEPTAVLGILYAHNNYCGWLFENYILIWCYEGIWDEHYWCDFKFGNELIDYEYCKYIKRSLVRKNKNSNEKNILYFFIDSLIKGKYIFVSLDMYNIKEWWDGTEKKRHLVHQVVFWGVNNKKRCFYCADFLRGQYETFELPFELFVKAYRGASALGEKYIKVWEFRDCNDGLDIEIIYSQLKDFVSSRDSTRINFLNKDDKKNILFGFQALDRIKRYYLEMINENVDVRPIHLVKVYSEVMVHRLEFINVSYFKSDIVSFKRIAAQCSKIELMILKNNYDKRCGLNKSINTTIDKTIDDLIDSTKKIKSKFELLFINRKKEGK